MTRSALVTPLLCLAFAAAAQETLDEFKVKREEVFEFTQPPSLTRSGDRVTIHFSVKAICDVTIAVEDKQGQIVRHLVSGVLGPNAPEPFEKNNLAQSVVWDGKDDRGKYIDNKDDMTVRVSLGLKPAFEKNLFWSPYKRVGNATQLVEAGEEGVFVFEGRGNDSVKLFDHEGVYVRTVYPFPADKLDKVAGLEMQTSLKDGRRLPVKRGFVYGTLLTSGSSAIVAGKYKFGDGYAATAMAVNKGRIALAFDLINRLHADGSSGGLPLTGPKVGKRAKWAGYGGQGGGEEIIGPGSIAFSPDGKTLYLTGYMWREFYMGGANCLHAVWKMDYEKDAEPVVFAGVPETDKGVGSGNDRFHVPSGVACDAQGRVYVADYMNDRIQIFSPDGKHLKSIKTEKPAHVEVSPKTGEIWAFSWPVIGISNETLKKTDFKWDKVKPAITRFGPFEKPEQKASSEFPAVVNTRGFFLSGPMLDVTVDWWATQPTVWVGSRKYNISRIDVAWGGTGAYGGRDKDNWISDQVRLLVEKDGKWIVKRDFGEVAKQEVRHVKPPDFGRQRLFWDPKHRKLYEAEDSGFSKSFYKMREIDVETGAVKEVELPFDTEDLAFDLDGMAYLRTDTVVVRYDSETWKEVPWDYGEELANVGFTTLGGSKRTKEVIAGLTTPGRRPVCWHQGGMWVSPKGHLAVSCTSRSRTVEKKGGGSPWERSRAEVVGKPYTPTLYPGRARWQEIHVWDKRGKLIYEDAVPGLHILNGIGIDADDNLYVLAAANRMLGEKPYPYEMAGTVMKFKPKQSKTYSTGGGAEIALDGDARPTRPADLSNGKVGKSWVQGAEWLYGGAGFDGFNPSHSGGGCACWNSRFGIDYFARSFAPEVDHHSVAVLDSAGNLMLRIGRYGNVDSAGPGSLVPLGGDEVGLFYAAYVATHTDRRLFVADAGNARIVSVKLDYHLSRRLAIPADAGAAQAK